MIADIQGFAAQGVVDDWSPGSGTAVPNAQVDNDDLERFRQEIQQAVERLLRSSRVATPPTKEHYADGFAQTRLSGEPTSLQAYSRRLAEDVVPHAMNMASPRSLGHMSGWQPAWVRVLGEAVVALNQNLVKQEASRSFTLIERQTVGMLHRLVYNLPESFYLEHVQNADSTLGIMAAGSTVANITGLWLARNRACSSSGHTLDPEHVGMSAALSRVGCASAVVLGSALMHYSIDKAAGVLGLGTENVRKLEVDRSNRMDLRAVRRAIASCRERGDLIVALVGTAGTTDYGSIDPLAELADLAAEAGIHFHVDAAWGTALLFSQAHRGRLAGIERADTVTLDGHKQLHLPAGSNVLLCRDPSAARTIEKEAPYMLHRDSCDLGRRSLEGSRPATALHLHAALHLVGGAGYERMIDRKIAVAQAMAAAIRERPDFELLAEPETNIVVYRHLPTRARRSGRNGHPPEWDHAQLNDHNVRLQRAQDERGQSFVSRTSLGNTRHHPGLPVVALRAVIAHPETGEAEVRSVLDEQSQIGAALERAEIKRAPES